MTALDSIVGTLQEAGYAFKGSTIQVRGIELDFAGLFEGKKQSHDLVVLCDAVRNSAEKCKSNLRALFTLLERTSSHRPVSVVVLVDNSRTRADIHEMAHLCRLIVIDAEAEDLQRQMHAFSAIPYPSPIEPGESAEGALLEQLGDLREDEMIARLLKASREDSDVVESTVIEIIGELISDEETDQEP